MKILGIVLLSASMWLTAALSDAGCSCGNDDGRDPPSLDAGPADAGRRDAG